MLLSIVTGTYNRLSFLKEFVISVRSSIGIGITYEIVLVDGGSIDGTIQWAQKQADIELIEQGELLGAVKAFNAGFAAAKGEYVIIANDDIEFVDKAIVTALSFIEDNPKVGIGCFYQNRYDREWHVEYMHAIVNGKQGSIPYGQVCIIPKWLGDTAGWWGTEYHTYAGDNELSCNVTRLGYAILPIPCACIIDKVVKDELRVKNNSNKVSPTIHADSKLWLDKWTRRDGKVGPVVPVNFNTRLHERKMRILYAPIYEPKNIIQHRTKRGLRDAFVRHGYIVHETDYIANPLRIFDDSLSIKPDIILTQFHDASIYNSDMIRDLKLDNPHAIFINWNGDYFPENFYNKDYINMLKLYDIATFVTPDVGKRYDEYGINWKYWQIGFEESQAIPDRLTKRHDVVFLGNGHYDFRLRLGSVLRSLDGINVGLYGNWNAKYRPDGQNLYDYDTGHKLYSAAKISISDGRPNTKFVSNRIFQSMYAGCFTLQQWFPDIYDMLEYDEGVHFVTYKESEDLPGLIRYWMKHDKERKIIAEEGRLRTLERHSFDVRVHQLYAMLQDVDHA